jgi:FAD/FMN-containing dehydrogenase
MKGEENKALVRLEERVRAVYWGNYKQLVALKNRYDPHNCFALNQNIKPTIKEEEAAPSFKLASVALQ